MNKVQKILRAPGKVLNHLQQLIAAPLGQKDYRRFIILTRSRTGSNMLVSSLNSHPNICTRGELFTKLHGESCNKVLNGVFSKHPLHIKAVGFKIFYYHPLDDKSGGIWNELINMEGLHILHLKRRNTLRTLVSRKIAGAQDVWSVRRASSSQSREKAVEFTVEELRRGFEHTERWEVEGDRMFSGHPILGTCYEDLVSNPEREFKRILEFLGLQPIQLQTKLKKQNPQKLSELIVNYEEMKAAFSGTKWETFFEEQETS